MKTIATIIRAVKDSELFKVRKGDRCVKLTRGSKFTIIPCELAVAMPAYNGLKVSCEKCGKIHKLADLHVGRWCSDCEHD